MTKGISRKLIITYFIIIVATVLSGGFCLYVLGVNLRANARMRDETLPSMEHIKEMRTLMLEVKKLSNTWVYIANNKDQERLRTAINTDYTQLDSQLQQQALRWTSKQDAKQYTQIANENNRIIDSVKKVMALLSAPESYADDSLVDRAAELNTGIGKLVNANDKLLTRLIETKEQRLAEEQQIVRSLLDSLYLVVLFSILTVILFSYISLRFAKKNIVDPLRTLNNTILKIAVGEVVTINEISRADEIGQMHNAVSKMIGGITEKMNFAEQIGKGNYDADFRLLSENDKLGIALLTMRSDLKRSNEILIEQDRRLLDAQKLARIGNYFYNIDTGEFQSSTTLDDILGIDKSYPKTNVKWQDHILPEFHNLVAEKATTAIKERSKFSASYRIKPYKGGKECWVNTIGEYNYNEHGRAISMFGTMQDVTESKMLEIELNNSYKIAREQNNRLLNFSYIVSHNLRMHTVNIQGLLTLLDDAETEEEKTEFMNFLRVSSNQLDETLHQLNEVVAMKNSLNVSITPIALRKSIDHAIDLLKTNIDDKNAVIHNNVPADLIVNYNAGYMDSILLNFLSNAIKYSRPDRQPIVKVNCFKEHPDAENSKWILKISDNGLGIDLEKNAEKLFGMYKTFHGNKDAKGIGLFMTKYQVEAMDGSIEVESKVGEGTTFKISIK
ncbi:hypothetical protein CJD36_012295 [Flavipsychrobacter stenotrophus]|uniref:histidine kinase n=1 Tax=Flavipsychrobacter stenotrophus TaxID=2077091 RepID=A0A2S7SVI8_9BACT|nr:sensor histidine kinase [Flavipsychrobacter stenotrophus]PQJ10744.1 hypothetical protein CJD36_012295 [Flavipsychrobacter stenotrophus]